LQLVSGSSMGRQGMSGCPTWTPKSIMATLKLFGSLHADDDPCAAAGIRELSPFVMEIPKGTDSESGVIVPSSSAYLTEKREQY
jgi:hypothetical protein